MPMNSISTKTGDCGQTSLANGERVAKNSLVMEVIGTLDELNSWLGLVIADFAHTVEALQQKLERKRVKNSLFVLLATQKLVLTQVQHDLYRLSAVIAQAPALKFSKTSLTQLEKEAQQLEKKLGGSWQGKFLYPGGTRLAAQLDIARTICRRCERLFFTYSQQITSPPIILQYLNRLSDYLYLLRCAANLAQNHPEKPFTPDK